MSQFRSDLRFAWRTLKAKPVFTAIAVLSLALGIGANTAIFSVVQSALLRGLPYPHADRLIEVRDHQPSIATASLSPGEFLDYQRETRTFSGFAAHAWQSLTLTGQSEPRQLRATAVTTNFFDVLGARAERGRLISPKIDKPGSETRVAVISDALWRSAFGSDPQVIGRDVMLSGHSFRIIGVLGPKQAYPSDVDIWISPRLIVPEYQEGPLSPKANIADQYESHWLRGLGRLKPGVSVAQAQAEFKTIAAQIGKAHPDDKTHFGSLFPLQSLLVENVRPALWILLTAVVLLLLIACANLTGLLLARATGRTRELSIRVALGASRWEISRLLLSESLILAVLGGIAGIALASESVHLIVRFSPYNLPAALAPAVNFPVLDFCLGITLLSALLSGLIPALQSARVDVNEGLKEGSKGSSSAGAHRLRSILVGGEIAVSVMLLIGASLLVRSFSNLLAVNPGFDPKNVVTAQIALPEARYSPEACSQFWRNLLERVNSLPMVQSAASMHSLPIEATGIDGDFEVEGKPVLKGSLAPWANANFVSPSTFQTLHVPLIQGRVFDERDTAKSLPVAVIDQTLAERVFPRENPIGQRIEFYKGTWNTIIGVVGNVKYDGLDAKPESELYFSNRQIPMFTSAIVIRSHPGANVLPDLRRVVHDLDSTVPLTDIKYGDQLLGESLAARRFLLGLLTAFATLAVVLAAVGLYAVLAYSVQQRKREIGIRLALGATGPDILWSVLRQCLTISIVGLAVGTFGALWCTSFLKSMLYGVAADDFKAYAAAASLILLIAVSAALAPALRAARVDPVTALRYE